MYAIIVDGGRQFKVETGQRLDIDLRSGVDSGDTVEFENVLAIGGDEGLKLGSPAIDGAKVTAKVIGVEKGDKVYIQKFRRRKDYHRRIGHRQKYTRVEVTEIAGA